MKYSLDQLPLTNSFAGLGEAFYSAVQPTPFKQPAHLVHANPAVTELLHLNLDYLEKPDFYQHVSGERVLTNTLLWVRMPPYHDGELLMIDLCSTPPGIVCNDASFH